jgi:hypothetical protein
MDLEVYLFRTRLRVKSQTRYYFVLVCSALRLLGEEEEDMYSLITTGFDINLLHWRNTLPEKDIIVLLWLSRKAGGNFFFKGGLFISSEKSHIYLI